MSSTESSSVSNLQKQIDNIAEVDIESSHNASDLLMDLNLSAQKSDMHSSNQSDEQILNLLSDSQFNEGTPKSHKYDNSFSPDGSSFGFSLMNSNSNSPQSITSDHNSDIDSFLTAFNTKYNLAACTLFDVLDLIDSLLSNTEKEEKEVDNKPSKLEDIINNHDYSILKKENANLRTKLDEATNSMKGAQGLIQTQEQQISNLKSTISALEKSNNSLQNDVTKLQQSLQSIHGLMENQLDDLSKLGSQRSELMNLTKLHESIIHKYDQIIQDNQLQNKSIEQKSERKSAISNIDEVNKKLKDEHNSIICSFIQTIHDSQLPESILNQIHSIKDMVKMPLKDRLNNIAKKIIEYALVSNDKFQQVIQQNEKNNNTQQVLHKKCREILSMFEEELNFLQNLSHSTDLQSIVFNKAATGTAAILDEDAKAELIKHCAELGRFVEETIGELSLHKFESSFDLPDGIESTGIFDLLQPANMADKLTNIFDHLDKENLEARQVFDLFSAETFINTLLKNHINELLIRISQYSREVSHLRQELDDKLAEQDQIETMRKLIKYFKHRDSKLKRFLSQYTEVSEDDDSFDLIVSLLGDNNESGKNDKKKNLFSVLKENEKLRKELNRYEKEINRCQEKINQNEETNNSTKLQALESELDDYKSQCQEINTQFKQISAEYDKLKADSTCKDQRIEEFVAQIESAEISHRNAMKEANERIELMSNENKGLKQQINDFENTLSKVKKSRQQLGLEIDRLKKINIQLTESIDAQYVKMKNEYNATVREHTEANDKLTREVSDLKSQVQILTAKNQQLTSENATLNISKKSADLKLRSIDEKLNLEKRNLQSQISAQVAAANIEQSKKVAEMNSFIETIVDRLISFTNQSSPIKYNLNDKDSNNKALLNKVLSAVEEELYQGKKSQNLYLQLLEEVESAEKLLNIQSSNQLLEAIQNILSEQSKNGRELSENERKSKSEHQELDRLRRDCKRYEQQSIQLKQWENWAKRIHRIVQEVDCTHLDSDQLRLSLEEALLASVSSSAIFLRIDLLRAEKNILQKFDKRMLNTKQNMRSSIRPGIAICLFIRRLQKYAGCLSFSISNTDAKLAMTKKVRMNFTAEEEDSNSIITIKKTKTSSRKKKSRSESNERTSQKPAVIPILD